MPVTVVGSIAFDAVKTPFGEHERMLGGAAVHFALAASFFDVVRIVGPVGDDFGESELEVLRRREIDVSGIEHVPGGRTFFWRGEYGWDLDVYKRQVELWLFLRSGGRRDLVPDQLNPHRMHAKAL